MPYVTNPCRRSPIAFGSRRRGYDGPVRGRGLGADPIPSSSSPNPPGLVAGPSPLLVQSPVSANPLDFVSPQSAIAAGLPAAAVNAVWTQKVNSFPSVQTAINAGLAPAVVTEFWNGGPPPVAPPWWKRNLPLLIAGGGAVLLAFAGHHREAR
jgi:hypothetical protein